MLTTEWKMSKHKYEQPVNHAPYTVSIPSGLSETAFLRRLARKGATIITLANGERVAQLGHAVSMRYNNTTTEPLFATVARREMVRVSGVSVARALATPDSDN